MPYRLVTYQDPSGPRSGLVIGDDVHDIGRLLQNPAYASVRGILDDWECAAPQLAEAAASDHADTIPLSGLELLPPVAYPGAIYCAGANYRDHVDNMARRLNIAPEPDPHELGFPACPLDGRYRGKQTWPGHAKIDVIDPQGNTTRHRRRSLVGIHAPGLGSWHDARPTKATS